MSRDPDWQTDDGLYCEVLMRIVEPAELKDHRLLHTENPPLAEGNGSTALPGVAPVGVAEINIPGPVKLQLPIGAFRTKDHRYYWNGEGPFPSVTTILNDVLSKHALIRWKQMETVRVILRDQKAFNQAQWDGGDDAAISWAIKQADQQGDEAAKLGSSIHLLADMQSRMPPGASETAVEGFQVSNEEIPYLEAWRAFEAFLEAHRARIVSSEHMVCSSVGYAGTYDLIIEMPHRVACTDPEPCSWHKEPDEMDLWLVDIKTSKGIYPEYALQLVAYGKAEQIILEGTPVGFPMPKIDRYGVLHLRPDAYPGTGYRLWEYPITDEDYYRFISVLDLYLWRKEDRYSKKNLIAVM